MLDNLPEPFFDSIRWTKAGEQIPGTGEIHVWKANLDNWGERLAEFHTYLSELEKKRADRLMFEGLRQHFTAGHAITRLILGQYLKQRPGEVEIAIRPGGKPVLAGISNQSLKPLLFNLSHSGSFLLVSISRHYDPGIDLETIRPEFEQGLVSSHFFSAKERVWLDMQQTDQKAAAFFKLWTCKEAVLKAEGGGIRRGLEEVHIEFGPETGTARASLADLINAGRTWSIKIFGPAAGYTAALAFENDASAIVYPKLSFYQWTG